jgi:hypothetical protein
MTRLQLNAYRENSHYRRGATLTGQRGGLHSGHLPAWIGFGGIAEDLSPLDYFT